MTDVTRILSAIDQGDPHAAEQLLPLVYKELRKLAAQRLAQEKPGQTLQATALPSGPSHSPTRRPPPRMGCRAVKGPHGETNPRGMKRMKRG